MHILALGLALVQVQLGSIDGIVTKPLSSEPVSRATVTLIPIKAGEPQRSAMTEDDGHFRIPDVVPGDYQLGAESPRYGRARYGQRRPDGPSSVLSLGPGQQISGLRLSMVPTGAIAGRITGRNGEPAVRATVQALKYIYQGGKRVLLPAQIATTDDQGEYRLFWLPAGQYVVAAALNEVAGFVELTSPSPPGMSAPSRQVLQPSPAFFADFFLTANVVNRVLEDGTMQEESWATVFYPSSTEARFAVPIDLSPGATMSGVNISIGASRTLHIRGRIIGADAGSLPIVTLLPENSVVEIRVTGQPAAPDGSFEFEGIRPGTYYLAARTGTGFVSIPVPVEVRDQDIDDLRITLTPGIQIGVNVLLDNPSENSGLQPFSATVLLFPDDFGLPVGSTILEPRTGRIMFNSVVPGNYQFAVNPTGDPALEGKRLHVKSVRLENEPVGESIQITADMNPAHLEIVLTNESGSLEGSVSGAGQIAVPGATVVLVPATGRKRANLYSSATTDGGGRFLFVDIAPGDYKLFAWDDIETGAWQNPDFMRLYEARGQTVHVSGNSKQNLRLTVIHNP